MVPLLSHQTIGIFPDSIEALFLGIQFRDRVLAIVVQRIQGIMDLLKSKATWIDALLLNVSAYLVPDLILHEFIIEMMGQGKVGTDDGQGQGPESPRFYTGMGNKPKPKPKG